MRVQTCSRETPQISAATLGTTQQDMMRLSRRLLTHRTASTKGLNLTNCRLPAATARERDTDPHMSQPRFYWKLPLVSPLRMMPV
jgi:hypothetical protein